ncbi:hypothetical protein V3F56_08470 [Moorellaceae bacterium AZ2]
MDARSGPLRRDDELAGNPAGGCWGAVRIAYEPIRSRRQPPDVGNASQDRKYEKK